MLAIHDHDLTPRPLITIRPADNGFIVAIYPPGLRFREHVFATWPDLLSFLEKNPCPTYDDFVIPAGSVGSSTFTNLPAGPPHLRPVK